MNEFKGTPGPWNMETEAWITDSNNDRAVARITRYNLDAPTQYANAQLIAAAPELLGALQSMMNLCDETLLCTRETKIIIINKAQAAIAKALGETK